jgi:transposase-like protein
MATTPTPRAIREELGEAVVHRTNRYLNNWIEQDHRAIKQRYRPMRGFGAFESAARFCRAFDELQNFYRPHRPRGATLSLSELRNNYLQRTATLEQLLVG